jgi:23S rRNA (guanosine2251-2'-O)-methyltransferase
LVGAVDTLGETYYKSNLKGKLALVIGGEGEGISRLVGETCDFKVSIPMTGEITSLNASNAAAVVMYEVYRQRNG